MSRRKDIVLYRQYKNKSRQWLLTCFWKLLLMPNLLMSSFIHTGILLYESSPQATLLLWNTYIRTCILQLKEIQRQFSLLFVMKSENSVQRLFYRELLEAVHTPGSKSCLPQEPHSASQPQIARASNWVCELYHTLFWPSVNKMCPKISENPKRSYFSGLGMLKNFLIWVSGTCSLLYATLACLRVYSNTVG